MRVVLHRITGLAVVLTLLIVSGCTTASTPERVPESASTVPATVVRPAVSKPNIVFVLADDLSDNLVPYMPNLLALQKDGTTFANYTVTDSLCCPSRASILTGRYPHNTGIVKNNGSDGGFKLFHRRGEEKSTFATDLKKAGYQTAFYGKYLNEYWPGVKVDGEKSPHVPDGWDEWAAGGDAYQGYNYRLNENGKVRAYGNRPQDYLTDVLSAKARGFITRSTAANQPFLVEIATYTPHLPYVPAPQDTQSFAGLTAPRTPAYGRVPTNAPPWLATHSALTASQIKHMDSSFRRRVQSVQAIDRMLGDLRDTLTKTGAADDTLVVVSSDNGYHLGEYRLNPGKMTAFETDIKVPLVIAGPGTGVGQVVDAPAENIDLRPTFADVAEVGVPAEVDGRSLRPLLAGQPPPDWRTAALVEHSDPATDPADPDYNRESENIPPSYDALRTNTFTYVEYVDGSHEYYDRRSDPNQLLNLAGHLDAQHLARLHTALKALATCSGAVECGSAGRTIR